MRSRTRQTRPCTTTGAGAISRIALVVNGSYDVTLHFAETYNTAAGQRRFNVSLQGQRVLEEFDIAATAGIDTALQRTFRLNAGSAEIVVQVGNGSVGNARLDALQIVRSPDSIFAAGFEGP